MKLLCVFFVFFQLNYLYSQLNYKELSGVIRINDSLYIPYEVYLKKGSTNKISGYSITDKNGSHETKSNIKGIYNAENNILKFEEYDIVYTKSSFNTFDFCFIHFEEKVINFEKFKALKGDFYGKFTNGATCINGKLLLADKSKLEAKKQKVQKKLKKAALKKNSKIKNSEVDSIKLNNVVANEALNVFMKSTNCKLYIYDSGKIDNDRINLYVDDQLILEDFAIEKGKKEIPLTIKNKKTTIKVLALNEGTSAPNTVKIEIKAMGQFLETRTLLKTQESASLVLIRK